MNEENSIHKNKIILLFLNYIIINHKKNILFKLDEMTVCVWGIVVFLFESTPYVRSSLRINFCSRLWGYVNACLIIRCISDR